MTSNHKQPSAITKAHLVEGVYAQLGFSKKESYDLVEMVFETIKETLKHKDGVVKISGFGRFTVREKKERMGRNPQTGDRIKITKRKVLSFKPSHLIKDALNDK